jgi:beta-galactosidase/beta-glucuronidase
VSYEHVIRVPFPVESGLSGIARSVAPGEVLWYRRTVSLPSEWSGHRVHLNIEASDWETRIWINGERVGQHRGGYDPFFFDITPLLESDEQEIVIAVRDVTDTGNQPRGKQVLHPEGIYYTPASGIWGTVWLEPVPTSYIRSLKVETDIDREQARLQVDVESSRTSLDLLVQVMDDEQQIASQSGPATSIQTLDIPAPHLWSPEDPFLYGLEISLFDNDTRIDKVSSYLGMRKIGLERNGGVPGLFLNNRPLFQIGTLDQGYWPDGVYTPPSDDALKYDIQVTKRLGFNMLRKHVKVESRRFYTWCDRLGVLVWQDMPSGDKMSRPGQPDIQRSPDSARQFERELKALIDTHYNHPSVIMWIVFNEGWGQYDTERLASWVKKLDSTRLVSNASGWNDRGVGDVQDIHHYPEPEVPPSDGRRALVLGEFGGMAIKRPGHSTTEEWGHSMLESETDLLHQYETYIHHIQVLDRQNGLCAAVYTQITDVETEKNGLMTYDRRSIKLNPDRVRATNMWKRSLPDTSDAPPS